MRRNVHARIAKLELRHQAILARSLFDGTEALAAIEKIRQELLELGVEQLPGESFAQTICRGYGIDADELKSLLHEAGSRPEASANSYR